MTNPPPYPPKQAALGGIPTILPDVPIAGTFLVLYIAAAIGHMTIFKFNMRRGHKFFFSAMIFGYCMARIMSLVLRITWAAFPHNVRLAIAANVFIAAGVLILYFVNLIFSQRIIRATHPKLGWGKPFSTVFIILYALMPLVLAMIVAGSIQSFYTLNTHVLRIDEYIRVAAETFLLFFSFLPLPLLGLNYVLPRSKTHQVEHFGTGRWRSKIALLLTSTILLISGTGFRAGTAFEDLFHPRALSNPGWYHSKTCFWIFSIVVELIVVYLYLLFRVDRRFWIPNGSYGPGSYSLGTINQNSKCLSRSSSEDGEADQASSRPPSSIDDKKSIADSWEIWSGLSHPPPMPTLQALIDAVSEQRLFARLSVGFESQGLEAGLKDIEACMVHGV